MDVPQRADRYPSRPLPRYAHPAEALAASGLRMCTRPTPSQYARLAEALADGCDHRIMSSSPRHTRLDEALVFRSPPLKGEEVKGRELS